MISKDAQAFPSLLRHPLGRALSYWTEPQISERIPSRNTTLRNRGITELLKLFLCFSGLTYWACFLSLHSASRFFKLTYLRRLYAISCLGYEISALLLLKDDSTDVPKGSPHFLLFFQEVESDQPATPLHWLGRGARCNRSLDLLVASLSTVWLPHLLNFSWFGTHVGNESPPITPIHIAGCTLVTGLQEDSLGKMTGIGWECFSKQHKTESLLFHWYWGWGMGKCTQIFVYLLTSLQ